MTVPEVRSCERTTPLTLTVWMLEKSAKIPVPCALVVWGGNIYGKVKHRVQKKELDAFRKHMDSPQFNLQPLLTIKLLPQALVMLSGKVNLATGGVTDSSKVPLHSGLS